PLAGSSDDTRSPTVARATDPGTVLGTVGYMSPEQVRGKPVDQRSDIFSFGSVLYEMLSGQRAFQAASPAETMAAIAREDPRDLSEIAPRLSPGLDRVVRHCLEKDPADRFQSARDLAFDLLSQSSVSSPQAAQEFPPAAARRRWAAVGAGLLLLLLGALAGRLASAGGRTPAAAGQYAPPTDTPRRAKSGLRACLRTARRFSTSAAPQATTTSTPCASGAATPST